MKAVIVLGHGSRAEGASNAMERVVELLRLRHAERIEPAYMELAEPSLATVLGRLHADGIRQVVLVPYFLHFGIHLREDIPALLRDACAALAGLEVVMAPNLGYDDALVEVVERRLSQAPPFEAVG
jgi:sirohydrochlorin cobaltochelatase